jgi:hypothetical protein
VDLVLKLNIVSKKANFTFLNMLSARRQGTANIDATVVERVNYLR